MSDRIIVRVPSCFVVPAPPKPEPPPIPGTVTPEMLGIISKKQKEALPLPFLVPWKQFHEIPRLESDPENQGKVTFPVMVDTKTLKQAVERYEIAETTLFSVFKNDPDAQSLTKAVIQSMENPFASNSSPIVWSLDKRIYRNPVMGEKKLGGKKLRGEARHRALLQGNPWSIRCFGEPGGVGPRKNMIYGPDGNAVAQIDFGHGTSCGIHAHALVKGNLEHTAVEAEDHLFPLRSVPWFWTVIPEVTKESVSAYLQKKNGMQGGGSNAVDLEDDSDDDVNEMLSVASPLPDTTEIDKMDGWVKVSLPFEDYMGSATTSFEYQ